MPIIATCCVNISVDLGAANECNQQPYKLHAKTLRWDRADLKAYSNYTQEYLQPILNKLLEIESADCTFIDISVTNDIYAGIVEAINLSAVSAVPACRQNFFQILVESGVELFEGKLS